MFSLIIVVTSIVLVAALALATIYYGGDAFSVGGNKAETARLMNEGAQISGAATVYRAEQGGYATNIAALTTGVGGVSYLQSSPGSKWSVYEDTAVVTDLSLDVCTQLNTAAGFAGAIPRCDDSVTVGTTLCCESVVP